MSADKARNIETIILRALAEAGQAETASRALVTPTRMSRWKNEAGDGGGLNLAEVSRVLAELGLSLVDTTSTELMCLPRDEYMAMVTLARKALRMVEGAC